MEGRVKYLGAWQTPQNSVGTVSSGLACWASCTGWLLGHFLGMYVGTGMGKGQPGECSAACSRWANWSVPVFCSRRGRRRKCTWGGGPGCARSRFNTSCARQGAGLGCWIPVRALSVCAGQPGLSAAVCADGWRALLGGAAAAAARELSLARIAPLPPHTNSSTHFVFFKNLSNRAVFIKLWLGNNIITSPVTFCNGLVSWTVHFFFSTEELSPLVITPAPLLPTVLSISDCQILCIFSESPGLGHLFWTLRKNFCPTFFFFFFPLCTDNCVEWVVSFTFLLPNLSPLPTPPQLVPITHRDASQHPCDLSDRASRNCWAGLFFSSSSEAAVWPLVAQVCLTSCSAFKCF